MFEISLAKENFKFSCSHFTIFGEGKAEPIHGHNYKVKIVVTVSEIDPKLAMSFDFNKLKPLVVDMCKTWDEKFLLPEKSGFLKIEKTETQINFSFGLKKYSLPKEDVACLPLTNITAEALTQLLAQKLSPELKAWKSIKNLKVTVEETAGQSASFICDI